nr:MAG TPA: hypothetical protein [Caudoviricetes sp.]
MNKIISICWIIINTFVFVLAIDYLILTISLILKGNYGFFSTVSMVAVIVFAGIKAIENILNEIE